MTRFTGTGKPTVVDKGRDLNHAVAIGQLKTCDGDLLECDENYDIIIPVAGGSQFVYQATDLEYIIKDTLTDVDGMWLEIKKNTSYVLEMVLTFHVNDTGTIGVNLDLDHAPLTAQGNITQNVSTVNSETVFDYNLYNYEYPLVYDVAGNGNHSPAIHYHGIIKGNADNDSIVQLQLRYTGDGTQSNVLLKNSYIKLTQNGCFGGGSGGGGAETDPVFTEWLENYQDTSGMNVSWRGAWGIPGSGEVNFYVNDVIIYNNKLYYCTVEHTDTPSVYQEPSDVSAYWDYMCDLGGSGSPQIFYKPITLTRDRIIGDNGETDLKTAGFKVFDKLGANKIILPIALITDCETFAYEVSSISLNFYFGNTVDGDKFITNIYLPDLPSTGYSYWGTSAASYYGQGGINEDIYVWASNTITDAGGTSTSVDIMIAYIVIDITGAETMPEGFTESDPVAMAAIAELATVASTGDYDDLTNKPTIPAGLPSGTLGQTIRKGASNWEANAEINSQPYLLTINPENGTGSISFQIDNRSTTKSGGLLLNGNAVISAIIGGISNPRIILGCNTALQLLLYNITNISNNTPLKVDSSGYLISGAFGSSAGQFAEGNHTHSLGNLTDDLKRAYSIQVFQATTALSTGDGKAYFVIPDFLNGKNLISCYARVITAGTTNTLDIQINNVTDSVDMLSTKLTIDSGETGSDTAATAYVIDTSHDDVATNDLLRIDIDAVQTTAPYGLIVLLEFQ